MSNLIQVNNGSTSFKPTLEDNFVVHSKLNAYQKDVDQGSLSVKLVLDGAERYTVNNKRYDLMPSEFILVDSKTELGISFSDTKVTEGMCFYLDEKYLSQNFALGSLGEKWSVDNYIDSNQIRYNLLPTKYRAKDSAFGLTLKKIAYTLREHRASELNEDFFLDFAQQLTLHQKGVFDLVNKLSSLKLSTREELFCRVKLVKDYIKIT